MRILLRVIAFCFLGLVTACGSTQKPSQPLPPPAGAGIYRQTNQGYSLLYKLISDESDVGKIFIFKSADDSLGNAVREIGKACGSAKDQMDEWQKQDKRIEFDVLDLPYIEQRSRDLQASIDEKALLGSSGKEFELKLAFTQVQAMDYAAQLCKAMAEKEQDAGRKAFLEDLGTRCQGYGAQMVKFLHYGAY